MSSARRIDRTDYNLIEAVLTAMASKLKARPTKAMHKLLDVPTAMRGLYQFEHAFIVNDSFLVVYEMGQPWYSHALVLQEALVLRLVEGADFRVVPSFLEAKAQEAGADLVLAGTALAKSDRALASMYKRHGFREESVALVKEPDGISL